jgi:cytosine/adenosine deaminase-related metal-dependent hydrolase
MAGQIALAAPAFYLATLGGAASLYLDGQIGNFDVGKEADFVVLDAGADAASRPPRRPRGRRSTRGCSRS